MKQAKINEQSVSQARHKQLFARTTKSASSKLSTSPGPAAYTIKSAFQNKPAFSIPTSRPTRKITKKPDPWTYIPQDSQIKPRSPFATIGRQTRIQRQRKGPSPAHYVTNHQVVFKSARRPIFGTERRANSHLTITPGPANYDPMKSDTFRSYKRFVTIGSQKREDSNRQKQCIPGPNKYQTESDIDSNIRKKKGYSIGQRLKCKTLSDFPQDYLKYNNDKQAIMKKMPAFTFRKSIRKNQQEVVSPGPAAYFTAEHLQKGPIIGKSQRNLHTLSAFPGPDSYVIPSKQLNPSFSIPKAKMESQLMEYTPGPAKYSPQLPQSQKYKSISIGMGDRSNPTNQNKTPGPGQYDLTVRSTKGFSIGKEERRQHQERTSPGPAHYNIDPSMVRSKSNRRL